MKRIIFSLWVLLIALTLSHPLFVGADSTEPKNFGVRNLTADEDITGKGKVVIAGPYGSAWRIYPISTVAQALATFDGHIQIDNFIPAGTTLYGCDLRLIEPVQGTDDDPTPLPSPEFIYVITHPLAPGGTQLTNIVGSHAELPSDPSYSADGRDLTIQIYCNDVCTVTSGGKVRVSCWISDMLPFVQ